jgi:hypothetical protein
VSSNLIPSAILKKSRARGFFFKWLMDWLEHTEFDKTPKVFCASKARPKARNMPEHISAISSLPPFVFLVHHCAVTAKSKNHIYKCSRRDFMGYMLALTASGAILQPIEALAEATAPRESLIVGTDNSASLINLISHTVNQIVLSFKPHSFIQHPQVSSRFIAIEKWGPNAAEVDFETGSVKPLENDDTHHFYGHGFYQKQGNTVFISRVDKQTGLGYFTGYKLDDYTIINHYHVAPGGLHECRHLPDDTVMVTSSGIKADNYAAPQSGTRVAPSALLHIDVNASVKVIGEMPIPDDEQILGHFSITKAGQILALSGPKPGPETGSGKLYYSPNIHTPLKAITFDANLQNRTQGEMLSVALNTDETRAAVTNPTGKNIILIDMLAGTVIKTMQRNWHGVAFDPLQKMFVGSYPGLDVVDDTFKEIKKFQLEKPANNTMQFPLTGAHAMITNS